MKERPELADATKSGYDEILTNRPLPAFGDKDVDQITKQMIAEFKASVCEAVSNTGTNDIMGLLRYILNTRRGLVADNPALSVDTLKEEDVDVAYSHEFGRRIAFQNGRLIACS